VFCPQEFWEVEIDEGRLFEKQNLSEVKELKTLSLEISKCSDCNLRFPKVNLNLKNN
jgi:hypothetical protein